MLKRVLTHENLLAVGLFILIILLIVVTVDTAPTFIYGAF